MFNIDKSGKSLGFEPYEDNEIENSYELTNKCLSFEASSNRDEYAASTFYSYLETAEHLLQEQNLTKYEEYKTKSNDEETKFSDGSKVGQFWSNHSSKIIEELKKPEYDKGYEVARETVRKYMDKLTVEERVKEYIEMLNEEYEPKSHDEETEFSDGSKVGRFWHTHNPKIIEELEKPEYDKGYEVAREKVRKYMDQNKNRRQKVKDIKNIKEENKSNKSNAKT